MRNKKELSENIAEQILEKFGTASYAMTNAEVIEIAIPYLIDEIQEDLNR